MKNVILLISSLFLLAGCGSPGIATSRDLMPQYDFYDELSPGLFKDATALGDVRVSGGVKGTIPGHIDVSANAFRQTLKDVMRFSNFYAHPEEAKYKLSAVLTSLDQPSIGFTSTATSTINYTILRIADNQVLVDEHITMPCSKTPSEIFDGMLRARATSACAIGENITHFMKTIVRF